MDESPSTRDVHWSCLVVPSATVMRSHIYIDRAVRQCFVIMKDGKEHQRTMGPMLGADCVRMPVLLPR